MPKCAAWWVGVGLAGVCPTMGEVVTVMVALQEAGAPSVGLVTENPE